MAFKVHNMLTILNGSDPFMTKSELSVSKEWIHGRVIDSEG